MDGTWRSGSWQRTDLRAPDLLAAPVLPSIGGVLYPGLRHLLSGPPESLKTIVSWIFAAESGVPVAHVDFEMGARPTRVLLHELGYDDERLGFVHHFESPGPPRYEDVQALVHAGVGLLILDAAAGAFEACGLDDNRRDDVEQFAAKWINPFWRAGIATLVIDHVTKNAGQRGQFAIGSERKVGQVDVHLGAHVVEELRRGGRGRVRLRTHKDRAGFLRRPHAAEIHLASDPATHALTYELIESNDENGPADGWPREAMQAISRFLVAQSEPLSRSKVVTGARVRRETGFRAIAILLAEGFIAEYDGPHGGSLLQAVKPYEPIADVNPPVHDRYRHGSREPAEAAVPGSPPRGSGTGNAPRKRVAGDDGYLEEVLGDYYDGRIDLAEALRLEALHVAACRETGASPSLRLDERDPS